MRGSERRQNAALSAKTEVRSLDTLREGCQVISPTYTYLYVNNAAAEHGRTTREALNGRSMMDVYPGIENTAMFQRLRHCMEHRTLQLLENEFEFPDGSRAWFELRMEPVPEGVFILSVDINARKRAESEESATRRALATLSECSRTLVRATDEIAFLQDVCTLAVERAGYRMAWAGLRRGPGQGPLEVAAHAGFGEQQVALAQALWAEARQDAGASADALRLGHSVVYHCKDASNAGEVQRLAAEAGVTACMALNVRSNGQTLGALVIYADHARAFADAEAAVLEEVAVDMGFGIATLRARRRQEKAHAMAQETRRVLTTLIGNLPGMAYRCRNDINWTMEFASDGCCDLTGYQPEQLLDNAECSYASIIHEDDRQRVAVEVAAALEQQRSFVLEYRIVTADGAEKWVWEKGSAVLSPDGTVEALEGFITDVTERKNSERAAQWHTERLRRLSEAVQALSGARDSDAVTRIVRSAARQLADADGATFVLKEEELCHYVDEDAIAPLWKGRRFPMSECISGWAMSHHQAVVIEDVYADQRIPHEAYRPTFVKSLVMVPIRTEDPVGAIGVYWKVKRAASVQEVGILQALGNATSVAMENLRIYRALGEGRARTRAIQDHQPHALFVWQHQDPSFVLADFNKSARAITHDGLPEMLGQPLPAFETLFPSCTTDVETCFSQQALQRREVRVTPPGTETTQHMVLTYGFVPPDMVVLHAEDVTEHRRTEELLLMSQKLEAVGRLAGGIAHDFNNLLSVIISYTEFAIEQMADTDPSREDLVEVQRAGERAAVLTRQLLAFSRKQVLQPEVLSFNRVVSEIEPLLRRLLGEDIEIVINRAPDLGTVEADPGQLEQVIMNLAVNARDAMPDGGRLVVETSNVELDVDYANEHVAVKPGRYVLLSMADSGFGMDAATRKKVFEPFFTTKEKGRGTGLGLSTVYGIVKQSGGNVWVYSEPGKGTVFRIYLPRLDREETPQASKERTRTGGSETVLLVEDEEAVRKLGERVLSAAGYTVLAASNGPDALALCLQHAGAIDILLTDVVMPQMSGRQLAEQALANRPQMKVLYASGYTEDAIVHHGVLNPGVRFISKPFSAVDLTSKVRQVLDEKNEPGG